MYIHICIGRDAHRHMYAYVYSHMDEYVVHMYMSNYVSYVVYMYSYVSTNVYTVIYKQWVSTC